MRSAFIRKQFRCYLGVQHLAYGLGLLLFSHITDAADESTGTINDRTAIERLQLQMEEIERRAQQEIFEVQRRTDEQLQTLRADLEELSRRTESRPALAAGNETNSKILPGQQVATKERLTMHGDFRLRYEANSSLAEAPAWDRGVLRGRLLAAYQVADNIDIGVRAVTGDTDNPRTADVTVGDFNGDLNVSLDRAFASYRRDALIVVGGKFANPFVSTELVFDSDVNPQGLAGSYDFQSTGHFSSRVTGIYFPITVDPLGGDSDMRGVQLSGMWRGISPWVADLNAAYYDYRLGSLSPQADTRARGNRLAADGESLLSDFDLFDIVGSVTYEGFGDRWPLKLVGDYVENIGAAGPDDTGYSVELIAGRLDEPGGLLVRGGYSQAEKDSVIGYFSHDNIPFATNYQLYSLSADFRLTNRTFLGLTSYRFRRLEPELDLPGDGSWASRTRLNVYFSF